MSQPYLIGICGGSASGKSMLINALKSEFESDFLTVLSQDNYYKPRSEQAEDHAGCLNFDLPQAIDCAAFERDVERLLHGETVVREEYTFNNAAASPRNLVTHSAPLIVVEGLFIYECHKLNSRYDLRVFVDAPDELKLQRRINRDSLERGYPEEDVRYRWQHHVTPAFNKWLAPARETCDLVVTNNPHFGKGLRVLVNHLQAELSRQLFAEVEAAWAATPATRTINA